MKEKREFKRVEVSFPVECKLQHPQKKYFYTVSKNISEGGAKIITNDFLAKGHHLNVDINLIDSLVTLQAKVSWCTKAKSSDRYNAGLQFLSVIGEDKNMLVRFLNKIYNA
jgi:c-di-GMP-binding flagellar brake protein YcgR